MRTPAGLFCKAGARLLRPTGRRSSPFVRRPRASIHRPQRPTLPPACPTRAHASFPLVMAPFPQPLHALPSARAHSPLRPSPSARAHSPFRFFRFPRPAPPSSVLPSPALGRFPIPCARPLRPSPPAPPLLSRPFLQFRAPPLQKNAVRAAGLTRRGYGPGFRACIVRFCGPTRAVGGGGRTLPRPTVFCKKEEARHRGFARAALHESGRGCEYYRRGE